LDIFLFSNANNCLYRYSFIDIHKSSHPNQIV
jgi:hypothetical protein